MVGFHVLLQTHIHVLKFAHESPIQIGVFALRVQNMMVVEVDVPANHEPFTRL